MRESNMVKLGDLIEKYRHKCGDTKAIVSGVDINKQFIPTRANLEGTDISGYYVVPPKYFACNLMHIGRDERIPIAYNSSSDYYVVTSAYYVFRIKEEKHNDVLGEYLYIIFCIAEFDRLTWFYTDSSIRGNLREDRFLEIEIPLPSLAEQQKVVNAWKALREIKEQNEEIAAPLMQVCQSYIQELKHSATCDSVRIGDFIKVNEITNKENKAYSVLGLNKTKSFMPTVANTESVNLKNYKVVSHGMFAYSGMQTGRDLCIRIAYYDEENPCLISPAYTTFNIDESKGLLAVYFMMIFKRSEMDRLGWFYSDSSIRSNLDWERFVEIEIPLPPLSVQQAIVNIYNCANEAKKIAAEADRMSREVCPALIQHVINNN